MINRPQLEALEGRRLLASTPAGSLSSVPNSLVTLATDSVQATGLTKAGILSRLEAAVRGVAKYQDATGAIIDPIEKREVQYSTPYFAYAASTLINNGYAGDLLGPAVNALTHATESYSEGLASIPDQHGEFYLFPMAKAYKNLAPLVRNSLARTWLSRMKSPLEERLEGFDWNWRTYAMKGVWALYGIGALSRTEAVNFIESSWDDKQHSRFTGNSLGQYEDTTSDPDTIAYDYAARANLMYLVTSGYDGESAESIRTTVMRGNAAGLYLLDPTGQVSNTGRSSNHVWNDLVAAVGLERSARVIANNGFAYTASTYHRAAALALLSTDRWQQPDGLYQVTKNNEDPAQKRGYADYSGLTNYNGYMILHLSELAEEWRPSLGENAMPSETGGYALKTDDDFATAVADAGGVHVNAALRGQEGLNYEQYWTQMGVTRVSEAGWDSRLGSLSGQDRDTGSAFSLAPAVYVNGRWKRMADIAGAYEAEFTASVTSPEITRADIVYTPKTGITNYPTLYQSMTLTRDGVMMKFATTGPLIGATLPLLVNDGQALAAGVTPTFATTAYKKNGDSLSYLMVDRGQTIANPGTVIKGATGDYIPLLATRTNSNTMSVFIYTKKAGEFDALALQNTIKVRKSNYASALGSVTGNVYVGAGGLVGGYGTGADYTGDGVEDIRFASPVHWVLQLRNGSPFVVEADDNTVYYHGSYAAGLTADVARRIR